MVQEDIICNFSKKNVNRSLTEVSPIPIPGVFIIFHSEPVTICCTRVVKCFPLALFVVIFKVIFIISSSSFFYILIGNNNQLGSLF